MQLKHLLFVALIVAAALAQFDGGGSGSVPKLRGLDKIGIGFDVVKAQLMMSPIELTYMGRTFVSPYDDQEYEIPMELASISTPNTFINTTTNVWNTVDEFQTTQARSSGISLNLGNMFAFTNTKETRQIKYTMDNRSHRFGVTQQIHTFYDVKLFPPFLLQLSYPCREFLRRLPRYSEATKAQYFQFFDYFGTHYVMQAELGGTVRREELADIRNLTRLDENYVKKQFSISFNYGTTPASSAPFTDQPSGNPTGDAQPGQPIPTSTDGTGDGSGDGQGTGDGSGNVPQVGKRAVHEKRSTLDGSGGSGGGISFGFSFNQMREDLRRQLEIKYTETSHVVTRLLGGNPALYEPADWREWVSTVVKNPIIVTYTLGSIADLIQDPVMQADMAQAIAARNSSPR